MGLSLWVCVVILLLSIPLDSYRFQSNRLAGRPGGKRTTDSKPVVRKSREYSDGAPLVNSPIPASILPYKALSAMKSIPSVANITKDIGLPSNKSSEEDLFSIGYMLMGWISNIKGLDGELKLHLVSNLIDDNFLNNKSSIYLRSPRGTTLKPFTVVYSKFQKKTIHVLKLRGLNDADLAGTLKRHAVYVRKADVPELEEDEFLMRHILGMQVYVNTSGVVDPMPMGRVTRVYTPEQLVSPKLVEIMHGIIEIQRFDNGRFTMIPFTDEFIPTMDVQKRFMIIEPWENMLDVTFTNPKRKKRAKQSREMIVDGDSDDSSEGNNPFYIAAKKQPEPKKPPVNAAGKRKVESGTSEPKSGLTQTEKRRLRAERAAERRAAEKLAKRAAKDSLIE